MIEINKTFNQLKVFIPSFEDTADSQADKIIPLTCMALGPIAWGSALYLYGSANTAHGDAVRELSCMNWNLLTICGQISVGGSIALPLDSYLHEVGHVIAMLLLFSDSSPKIKLQNYGYDGGASHANVPAGESRPRLSKLGHLLGYNNSDAIISASGPIVTCINLIAITCLSRSQFYVQFLLTAANIAIGKSFFSYAISTYEYEDDEIPSNLGHDFLAVKHSAGRFWGNALACTAIACSVLGIALPIGSLFPTILQKASLCTG